MSNPIPVIKEKIQDRKESKQLKKEQDYWDDVFTNLENYDGTPESQKEVRNVEK